MLSRPPASQLAEQQPGCRWTSTPTSLPLANANGSDLRDRWSGPPGEDGQMWVETFEEKTIIYWGCYSTRTILVMLTAWYNFL